MGLLLRDARGCSSPLVPYSSRSALTSARGTRRWPGAGIRRPFRHRNRSYVYFLRRWQQSPESGKATLAWRRGLLRQAESYRGGCSLGLGGASPVLGGGSCVLGASGGTALLGSSLAGDAASSPLAGVSGSTSRFSRRRLYLRVRSPSAVRQAQHLAVRSG